MTPAELARIRRIMNVRAAQLRMAETAHARDRALEDAAQLAEHRAVLAVDEAAEAASRDADAEQAVDDLVEARLRVAFLSRLAAQRGKEVTAAASATRASGTRLRASATTSEQMKTWFDGAASELRRSEDRLEDALRDELATRRAAKKVTP